MGMFGVGRQEKAAGHHVRFMGRIGMEIGGVEW
jgi:hypothetical protein